MKDKKEKRGRKRKFNSNIPAHIDQGRLPKNCYWDNTGKGHWYTTFKDETNRQRRKRIAGPFAKQSDLEKIIEEYNGIDRQTFRWVATEYLMSLDYKSLSKSTQDDYQYSHSVICNHQTKLNKVLADIHLSRWDRPLVQKLVYQLAERRGPSTAKHVHSFIRLVFRWGENFGYCKKNPAIGTKLPKQRNLQRLPSQQAYDRLLHYAKVNGTFKQKIKGSCPHYIWAVMEIEYLCRLRGIECRNLSDEHLLDDGLIAYRRKGSNTNITTWNKRLSSAVNFLKNSRNEIWERNRKPYPLKRSDRPLVVNTVGDRLKNSAYQSAWQRFITNAITKQIINPEDRFSLHDLKRKGITDTKGSKADKMDASGHKDERMMDIYDKEIKSVEPAAD